MAAADVESLRRTLSNLVAIVETQTAAWAAAGCPPTFSVDGESYAWNEWLDGKLKAIETTQGLINRLSGPWLVASRGRV